MSKEKCNCGADASEKPHSCPYAEEIEGCDSDEFCNCCEFCIKQCKGDIQAL